MFLILLISFLCFSYAFIDVLKDSSISSIVPVIFVFIFVLYILKLFKSTGTNKNEYDNYYNRGIDRLYTSYNYYL